MGLCCGGNKNQPKVDYPKPLPVKVTKQKSEEPKLPSREPSKVESEQNEPEPEEEREIIHSICLTSNQVEELDGCLQPSEILEFETTDYKGEIFFRNEEKEIVVEDTELTIRLLKIDPVQDETMAFVQTHFNTRGITKEDATQFEIGGVDVTNQLIGWIQAYGEVQTGKIAITKAGALQQAKPILLFIFHISIQKGTADEELNNLPTYIINLLETASVFGLESISIPHLMSPENLETCKLKYFEKLLTTIEQWVLFKKSEDDCVMKDINICCPESGYINMVKMHIVKRYQMAEEEE